MKSARRMTTDELARILVDADLMGDTEAAKRHGCTDRTIRNYRARMASDSELSAAYRAKKDRIETSWCSGRVRFLRTRIDQLSRVLDSAEGKAETLDDFLAVARQASGSLKIIGELDVASTALGGADEAEDGELAAPDSPDTPPSGDASPAATGGRGSTGSEDPGARPAPLN